MRSVRPRRDYREAISPLDNLDRELHQTEDLLADEPLGVSLPINII
jgi:hypothetical protein